MPRPNLGPRLVPVRNPGWTRTLLYIRWTEGGRTREKSTGISQDEPDRARKYFEDWLAERRRLRAARTGDPAAVRVADVLTAYQTEHGGEVAAPETLGFGAAPLRAFFATDTVADLTPGRVKEYWAWRRKHSLKRVDDSTSMVVERGVSDGTIIRELGGTLRPALRHAVKMKRLLPGEYHIPVPPSPRGRDYWITRSEAAKLLRETRRDTRARLHLPLYALVALYTGQRRGAILDLTWKQIDLVRGRIDFNPPGRIQTKKRRPIIPVPRSLLAALRRAQKRASSDFVIAYNGEPIKDVKTGFNSAAERAGIPNCTSHTLRHTAGTWMAQRGVPLRQISGWLGHSESRTTELYAHHHPDYLKEALDAFE